MRTTRYPVIAIPEGTTGGVHDTSTSSEYCGDVAVTDGAGRVATLARPVPPPAADQ
jgi:hypothetical protein